MENENDEPSGLALQRRLTLQSSAAIGVTFVRAKETYRAVEIIQQWAGAIFPQTPVRFWDCINGWLEFDAQGRSAQAGDRSVDPIESLMRIDPQGGGATRWESGAFIMLDLQKVIGDKHTATLRLLLQYSKMFVSTMQRLFIVVPDTFIVPAELQSAIPLVDLHLPSKSELTECLDGVLQDASPIGEVRQDYFDETERALLVTTAAGLTYQEAEAAFAIAIKTHADKWINRRLTAEEMNRVVLDIKTDIVRNSDVLEYMPSSAMEEVGGMEVLKEYLDVCVRCATVEARQAGVESLKGFALIGPPGTGKSMVAKATARALNLSLVRMDVGRLFGSHVGESEGKVRAALRQIVAMAPCVVLIDEVDKAGLDPRQASGDSGVGKRVLGSILTFMAESRKPIAWIFTANRVDSLPPEMLRKGRLDEVWAVLPPTAVERKEILRIHLAKRGVRISARDLEVMAKVTRGFVGAELESVAKDAVRNAFVSGGGDVTLAILQEVAAKVKPLSVTHADDFAAMHEWAARNARPTSLPDDVDSFASEVLGPGNTPQPQRRRRLK